MRELKSYHLQTLISHRRFSPDYEGIEVVKYCKTYHCPGCFLPTMRELKQLRPASPPGPVPFSPDYEGIEELQTKKGKRILRLFSPDYEGIEENVKNLKIYTIIVSMFSPDYEGIEAAYITPFLIDFSYIDNDGLQKDESEFSPDYEGIEAEIRQLTVQLQDIVFSRL